MEEVQAIQAAAEVVEELSLARHAGGPLPDHLALM